MKKIPRRDTRFLVQKMGIEYPGVDYFASVGIFMHFCGLFEWVISDILWENKDSLTARLESKCYFKRLFRKKNKLLNNYKKCNSREDIMYNKDHWISISNKLKLCKKLGLYLELSKKIKSPKILRNEIAHNQIYFDINIGASQFPYGYIKYEYDKDATEEMRKARKSDPLITEEEINLKLYDTYKEKDIRDEINSLVDIIGYLGYDINSDKTYEVLKKDGFFK